MAIIADQYAEVSNSLDKELDEGALGLILDNLQKYQYSFPFKSTIRELVSNSLDAHREREYAMDILQGRMDPAEIYVDGEGSLYKDSKWDPTYYDEQWLEQDKNKKIEIRYTENPNSKDLLQVIDSGVGLRETDRLPGYMKIGYSTKRLNRKSIGKYGIGAKAPLSTNVPFFTVRNYYNGWEYAFNIYSAKIEPIIPEKYIDNNGELQTATPFELRMGEGKVIKAYKIPTTRKNGLCIELEVKRHNKGEVVNAIKSQLMYFDNVRFTIVSEYGVEQEMDIRANILEENDRFIISDQNMFRMPHILIGGINYGLVNFDELELDKKQGALGIKVIQEEVEVTPSRESLIWSEKTKDMVVRALDETVEMAETLINSELEETDLLDWLGKALVVSQFSAGEGSGNKARALSQLKNIVDKDKIDLKFTVAGQILSARQLMSIFSFTRTDYDGSGVTRDSHIGPSLSMPMYWDENRMASGKKDRYLSKLAGSAFIRITPNYIFDPYEDGIHEYEGKRGIWRLSNLELQNVNTKLKLSIDNIGVVMPAIMEYMSTRLPSYGDVVVPKEEEVEEEVKVRDSATAKLEQEEKKRREMEEAKAAREALMKTGKYINVKLGEANVKVSTEYLRNINSGEIYYGSGADEEAFLLSRAIAKQVNESYGMYMEKNDEKFKNGLRYWHKIDQSKPWFSYDGRQVDELQYLIARTKTRVGTQWNSEYPTHTILMRVSSTNLRSMSGFRHINEFFYRTDGKTITMADAMIRWNTARIVQKLMKDYLELEEKNFIMLPNIYSRWKALINYVDDFYTAMPNRDAVKELTTYMDRLYTLQDFIEKNPGADPHMIGEMVMEVGGNGETAVQSAEIAIIDEAKEVLAVLSRIPILRWVTTTQDHEYTQQKQEDIEDYLNLKGVIDIEPKDMSQYFSF